MFKLMFKRINSLTSSASSPNIPNLLYFLQIHPFSTTKKSLKPISSCSDLSSFTVNYLINSCGFSPERALSASNYVKLKVSDNPDSVLNFFKDHAFSHTQILKLIKSSPSLLVRSPDKTFLPKIEFFKSVGISSSDIVVVISKQPGLLTRSLENHIIPFFNFFTSFLQSEEKAIAVFKRFSVARWFDNTKHIKVNIEILEQAGVPVKNIRYLVTYQPRIFFAQNDMFKKVVDEVIQLGFNPLRLDFVIAVQAFNLMSKSTRDKKVELYKKLGWSEDEIVNAFRKSPWCLIASEEKINSVMEFWVNKMGWKSSVLAKRPQVISYSLEKRIVPRSEVYRFLVSNGSLKATESRIASMLNYSDKSFRERFIDPYKDEAPGLIKLYEQKLDIAK